MGDPMTISRRHLILASAAALAATRANAVTTSGRNKPRDHGRRMTPLNELEPRTRAEIYRREAWRQELEGTRAGLYDAAIRAEPGALYRYLHFSWTHMHPTWDWPEWYAEQLEAIRWGYKQIGREPMEPEGKYFVLDREAELELQRRGLLGQIIALSAPSYATAVAVVAGAFHLWPGGPGASDSNNGILVAEGGTGPWATWSRFVRALETPEVSVGDTVYLHTGTYVPTTRVHATGGGTSLNSLKINVEGLPGDLAMIDWSVNDDTTMVQAGTGRSGIVIESANYRFRNLSFTSYEYGFGPQNGVRAMGCEFIELTRRRAGSSPSTGNVESCICIDDGSNNDDFLIEGCDLSNGNMVSGNGSTVYVIHARGTIRNNLIGADTNQAGTANGAGYALHIKRMNNSSTLGNLTIENNIIGRYSGSGSGCIYYNNTQYGVVQHNCFSAPGDDAKAIFGSDTGQPSSWPWYRNQLLHNTTRRSGANSFGLCIIDNNNTSGNAGTENTVRNNVIDGRVSIMPHQTPKTHNNMFDYQLYANSGSFQEFSATFASLASWRQATGFMPAPDVNSREEAAIVWDIAFNQWSPAAYALGAGSSGKSAASDGTDMGANTRLVGPAVVRPNPPTSLVAQ
jgi:hypothetical protein